MDEHRIPHYKIDKHAFYVIEKLRVNGYLSFLVGGSVRDLLLNSRPKDFDISTSAKPEEIKKIFKRNCILIGRRFRLAHIRFGKKIIEVSTFRAGETNEAELILRDNIWGSPEEDVLRRDFTINGLFYDPEVQTVIDYVGGYPDIEKKIIRTIGVAKVRFIQDPVRMIRLIKFKARFKDFEIEVNTKKALEDCKKEIVKSSPARILEELFKMLESGSSKRFFQLLTKEKLLDLLSSKLSDYMEKEKDVFDFLQIIDDSIKKNFLIKIERPVLVTSLIFNMLDKCLKNEYVKKNKPVHLGIIFAESQKVIEEVFNPFFKISRKLKAQMISILMNQYRFYPLIKSKKRKIKIPKDPFFELGLNFFYLRSMLDPTLINVYNLFNDKYLEQKKRKPIKPRDQEI
ncbi:MAG: polynucleotide adenylyltransferase PcnB [Parachlamydiales bacterium]|nr:polynucleotide adenylyltransferase PcnB [Parachlamydiales bacterium]